MIARGAKNNVSIFRKEGGLLPARDVVILYLKKAIEVNNNFPNTKYTLLQMYVENSKDPEYDASIKAKTFEDLCKIYGLTTLN